MNICPEAYNERMISRNWCSQRPPRQDFSDRLPSGNLDGQNVGCLKQHLVDSPLKWLAICLTWTPGVCRMRRAVPNSLLTICTSNYSDEPFPSYHHQKSFQFYVWAMFGVDPYEQIGVCMLCLCQVKYRIEKRIYTWIDVKELGSHFTRPKINC